MVADQLLDLVLERGLGIATESSERRTPGREAGTWRGCQGTEVLMLSAWIEPSSKRAWQAFLTSRCCSIRDRPSNCGAVTVASQVVLGARLVGDLDLGARQRRLDQQPDLVDGDRHGREV